MKKPITALFLISLSVPAYAESEIKTRYGAELPEVPRELSRTQSDKQERSREDSDDRKKRRRRGEPEFRTIDGYGNHESEPELGSAGETFVRMFENDYADGIEEPAGADRASARVISNAVVAQSEDLPNERMATDFLWQWGQFLDHDITETPTISPAEAFDIEVPFGDEWFDPFFTGDATIPLNRSFYEYEDDVREQVNEITSFIDASQVYGSDEERANNLRKLDGSGELLTTDSEHGDLLPYNEVGEENAPSTDSSWFLAGDIRANEQAALTAMHTLFVREHNYLAAKFLERHPDASGDDAYEHARMIVGAEMQHITYTEFLPLLLGKKAIHPYRGFRETADPSITNEFATAAFRFGHSLLPSVVRRVDADGETSESGDLELAYAFFDPTIVEEDGIENLLRGLATQQCQELDGKIVDALRNFLFGAPGSGGLDLASLNIQRGRDHGLPSYNQVREALGMEPAESFEEVNSDEEVAAALAEAYESPDDIDLWIGGLSEEHVEDSMVGPVFHKILSRQFSLLRDGDRFWYESSLPREMQGFVRAQTLAKIIRRNTDIGDEIQDNVFRISTEENSKPERPERRPSKRK
ncbi:MAG: peroxidase family protein [Luteolibacter sp.]